MVAPAIRYNNPGAMWGNKLAIKWGASPHAVGLNDGLGQGNNIAVFPTPFQGACAQFDLWQTGYVGMTLAAADKKWSGGNSSAAYVNFLCGKVPGLTPNTVISKAYLQSDSGWRLMKYQAQWEAGQPFPGMSDADWQRAQKTVFGKAAPSKTSTVTKGVATVAVGTGAVVATAAPHSGLHAGLAVLGFVVLGVVIAAVVGYVLHLKHESDTSPPGPKALVPPPLPKG